MINKFTGVKKKENKKKKPVQKLEDGSWAVVNIVGKRNVIPVPQWKKPSHPVYVREPKSLKNSYSERLIKVELGREGLCGVKIKSGQVLVGTSLVSMPK